MVRLRALGECVFEVGEHRLTPQSEVLFALLMYLSANAGSLVPRHELIELLWPRCDPGSARHRLRQALYQLRGLGVRVVTRGDSVVLNRETVAVDYVAFQQDTGSSSARCEAVTLEVLPRYTPAISRPFAQWVDAERDRVHDALRRCVLARLRQRLASGSRTEVVELARACLQLDPLNEEATIALAETLALQGDVSGAAGALDLFLSELPTGPRDAATAVRALRKRIAHVSQANRPDAATPTELVGRGDLVQRLGAWVNGGSEDEARIIALTGEAGIGKTRLLREGARIAALRGRRCVDYRSSPNGSDRPLAGLLDLLPQLLSLPGAVGCAPESFRRLCALAHGVPVEPSIPQDTTDSVFRFASLRRAVLDLVEALLVESGVLLVIDDAQWMDRPTLEILLDVSLRVGRRFTVLMAARPGGELASLLGERREVCQIRIPPLDAESARRIVVGRLSSEAACRRASLIDWAVGLANGNPFFLVELSLHCGGEDPSEALPPSLQVALERKLEALTPVARLVVQACAILGRACSLARLERALGLPPHETALALSELEATGLLAVRDAHLGCRHDLIAEQVIATIAAGVASYLHRRAASTLDEELQAAPTASLAWECALHWDAAGEHGRALEITEQIVDQLLALGLPKAAEDLCIRAERYARTTDQHAELLLRLSRARRLLDDWSGVIGALEQRRSLLANWPGGRQQYAEDEIALFEARWWRDYDGRVLRPALERVVDSSAPALHRLQMAVIALIVADNHQRRREARLIARHVESIEAPTPRTKLERTRAQLVFHTAFGDLDVAVRAAQRVVETERAQGTSAALLKALRWSSIPLKFTNEVARAHSALDEAFRVADRLGLNNEMAHVALYMADLALDSEDVSLARTWIPICTELAAETPADTSKGAITAYVRARSALMEHELDRCLPLLDALRKISDPVFRTRVEESLVALEVLISLRAPSRAIRRSLVQRLERLHLRTRWSGTRDFETGVLLLGLVHFGDLGRADALYGRYVGSLRRYRLPPHSILREAGTALAAMRAVERPTVEI